MKYKSEKDVKARVKVLLNEAGAWWFMYVPVGYGKSGVPDFTGCLRGRFFAIETKFGANIVTPLQHYQLLQIVEAGGRAVVINETNVESLKVWLNAIKRCS